MSVAVGVDVGGTNLRAALVSADGKVQQRQARPLNGRSPPEVIEQIAKLKDGLGPEAADAPMAVGFAAQLYVHEGVVAVAPNLGWRDVPLGQLLATRFGRPVRLLNDLDAIAMGEAAQGAGQGTDDLLCVFVGTGVGMGAVVQGRIVEGADGLATELGHIKIASPKDGRLCGCGERGCLEAYTSGRHLPELIAEKIAAGVPSAVLEAVPGALQRLTADVIESAALRGDKAACELWNEVGERLGIAIANVSTLLNPRVLVLGGGVLTAARSLRERVVGWVEAATERPHLARLSIRESALGDDAGLVGAGLLALSARPPRRA